MFNNKLVVLSCCFAVFSGFVNMPARCQQWSAPVLVSDTSIPGWDQYPDIAIDSNGVIHCAWTHVFDIYYSKVFYSYSADGGNTWTAPQDISGNESDFCAYVRILAGKNVIFIAYEENSNNLSQRQVQLKYFDGFQWIGPDTVTSEMPGAVITASVLDHTNHLYVFFRYNNQNFFKVLKDGIWNDPLIVLNEKYFLLDAVVDNMNDLHCAGGLYDTTEVYVQPVYFHYDPSAGTWDDIHVCSNYFFNQAPRIGIDNDNNPYLVFNVLSDTNSPFGYHTFFISKLANLWNLPEMIEGNIRDHSIEVDDYLNPHIFYMKPKDVGSILMHKTRYFGQWISDAIDSSSNYTGMVSSQINKNIIYVSYMKNSTGDQGYIKFSKLNVSSGMDDPSQQTNNFSPELFIAPNPCQDQCEISVKTTNHDKYSLQILDLQGRVMRKFSTQNIAILTHSIIWNRKDDSNTNLKPGLYFLVYSSLKIQLIQKFILLN